MVSGPFGRTDALVIQRFDRDLAVPGGRVHQEDFNQVLGAAGRQKYQMYGDIVNLKRIADVLRTHGEADDMRQLAVITTLGVAISNLDMHAKNLGLLHHADGPASAGTLVVRQGHTRRYRPS